MKIVIIEDEMLTARDLAATIKAIEPDAEILPFLYTVEEAIFFFSQMPAVDLIFADIQLGDGLSFDIFRKTNNHIPVIFCTAFDQYSLDAFKTAGIEYILKPFTKVSVERTLQKYKRFKEVFSFSGTALATVFEKSRYWAANNAASVIIHHGDKIIPVKSDQIALFFTEKNITFASTFEKVKYIVNDSLDTLEHKFQPQFFRCNRQFLVNRKAVKDASHYFNRKLLVNLNFSSDKKIVTSKIRSGAFISWLADY